MTQVDILALIDRELSSLNQLSESVGLSDDQTARLESLLRSREKALKQVSAEDQKAQKAIPPEQLRVILGGKSGS